MRTCQFSIYSLETDKCGNTVKADLMHAATSLKDAVIKCLDVVDSPIIQISEDRIVSLRSGQASATIQLPLHSTNESCARVLRLIEKRTKRNWFARLASILF